MGNDFSAESGRGRKKSGGDREENDAGAARQADGAQQALARAEQLLRDAGREIARPKAGFPTQRAWIEAIDAQEEILSRVFPDATDWLAKVIKAARATDQGNEHDVWLAGDRIIKATRHGAYGGLKQDTPVDYLRRIAALDSFFPRLETKIMGFVKSPGGGLRLVTEQAFVKGSEPSLQELETWLSGNGLVRDSRDRFQWRDEAEGLVFLDNQAQNWLKTDEGAFVPIDIYIEKSSDPPPSIAPPSNEHPAAASGSV